MQSRICAQLADTVLVAMGLRTPHRLYGALRCGWLWCRLCCGRKAPAEAELSLLCEWDGWGTFRRIYSPERREASRLPGKPRHSGQSHPSGPYHPGQQGVRVALLNLLENSLLQEHGRTEVLGCGESPKIGGS